MNKEITECCPFKQNVYVKVSNEMNKNFYLRHSEFKSKNKKYILTWVNFLSYTVGILKDSPLYIVL